MGSQLRNKVLYKDTRKISDFDQDLVKAIKNLGKEKDWVLVPSDKTNKWSPIHVETYVKWVKGHLDRR